MPLSAFTVSDLRLIEIVDFDNALKVNINTNFLIYELFFKSVSF